MVIGIPKEIMHGEGRVSAIPETVSLLKSEGFDVLVENTAGEGALFSDMFDILTGVAQRQILRICTQDELLLPLGL